MTENEFFTWLLIGLLAVIVIAGIVGAILFCFKPLPPWNGLTGQAYLDWKNGKSTKKESPDE